MNTFGNIYRLTSFGESHGPAVGGVVDGLPSGTVIDLGAVQRWLDRRRPGVSELTTSRSEADRVQVLSGLMAYDKDSGELSPLASDTDVAVALGTPVGFMVANTDARSADYDSLRHVYRPSHADYAWDARYGGIRDWRGGGRSSGRETLSRVFAGALAVQWLGGRGIGISSVVSAVGSVACPDEKELADEVMRARRDADSVGGIIECRVTGMPAGVGEPVFGKLQQMLASAMLSIGAVKGFDYGMGFDGVCSRGSEMVDEMERLPDGTIRTLTNHSGGIQGGISNGEDISFRVAVKPTPTIAKPLRTVSDRGENVMLEAHGRHDPSILLRIPVVVESMCAMVLMDATLMRQAGAGMM